jgi:hypothetical protein
MYCCKCGVKLAAEAAYCHKCGALVYSDKQNQIAESRRWPHPQINNPEDRALVEELLSIDRRPNRCHACGQAEDLLSWDFGVGKPVGTEREWAGTAMSVVLSALTLPLFGVGAVQLPGRSTRLRILPLKLVLCARCYQGKKSYESHPWSPALRRHGYTEFVGAEDLRALKT